MNLVIAYQDEKLADYEVIIDGNGKNLHDAIERINNALEWNKGKATFIPKGVSFPGEGEVTVSNVGHTNKETNMDVSLTEVIRRFEAMAPYWCGAYFTDDVTPLEFMAVRGIDKGLEFQPFTVSPKWLCNLYGRQNIMELSAYLCSSDEWSGSDILQKARYDTASNLNLGESYTKEFKKFKEVC